MGGCFTVQGDGRGCAVGRQTNQVFADAGRIVPAMISTQSFLKVAVVGRTGLLEKANWLLEHMTTFAVCTSGPCQAAQKLRAQRQSDSFTDPFSLELNKFLDDFLLSRLGCNMLMGQYLACTTSRSSIVNPQCDAFEICQKAADEVKRRCRNSQGRVPLLNVRAFTMSGQMATEGHVPRFSYIPGILMHVVRELLKNSCQASLELAKSEAELEDMPIDVIVCADKQHVVIRITDCARGIPRHVGSKIWSPLSCSWLKAAPSLSLSHSL